jgi:sulfonate transport system permease protein
MTASQAERDVSAPSSGTAALTPAATRSSRRYLGWILPVGLLALWQVLTLVGVIDSRYFPAPSTIVAAGWRMATEGHLIADVAVTLVRILVGFVIGGILGYAAGLATGTFLTARHVVEPMLSAIYTVPKLALLPVFLTIFGFGEAPKMALVSVTVFFYVWIYTMEAVVQIPRGYRDAARSFRVTRRQEFVHVIMPATLPSVFTGLRVAIAVAVLVTISSEFIIGNSGLGYVIFNSRALFRIEDSFVGIVVVAVLGYLLQFAVVRIGRRLTRWNRSGHVANVTVNV